MYFNYEEAKTHKQKLNTKNKADSDNLKKFDKYQSPIGLLPDHIRELPEYKELKKEFAKSFEELRRFNGWFVKTFKKEIMNDRKRRMMR